MIREKITTYKSSFLKEEMLNYNLGFNKDIVVVNGPYFNDKSNSSSAFYSFKNDLLKNPHIKNISCSNMVPGVAFYDTRELNKIGGDPTLTILAKVYKVDKYFFDTYGINFKEGRNFSREKDENDNIIINESVVRLLKLTNENNQVIKYQDTSKAIIGIVNDHRQEILTKLIPPVVYLLSTSENKYYSLKIDNLDKENTINYIQEKWNIYFPDNPFRYFFINDSFNRQYKDIIAFRNFIQLLVIIILIITCLGIITAAAFSTTKRSKEIGIRKILGSSNNEIIKLFIREYLILISIAAIISIPIVFYLMHKWLNNYVERISFGLWFFFYPVLFITGIALLSSIIFIVKAAYSNPIKILKEE